MIRGEYFESYDGGRSSHRGHAYKRQLIENLEKIWKENLGSLIEKSELYKSMTYAFGFGKEGCYEYQIKTLNTLHYNQEEFKYSYKHNLMRLLEKYICDSAEFKFVFDRKENPMEVTLNSLALSMEKRHLSLKGLDHTDPRMVRYNSYYSCDKLRNNDIGAVIKDVLTKLVKALMSNTPSKRFQKPENKNSNKEFTDAYNAITGELKKLSDQRGGYLDQILAEAESSFENVVRMLRHTVQEYKYKAHQTTLPAQSGTVT